MEKLRFIHVKKKMAILSILAKGESYGYEIIQKVRLLSQDRLQWTDGMLYPVLHRLERSGLVRSRWGRSATGRRRKYYRITTAGEKALHEELSHWALVDGTLSGLQEKLMCLCC